MTVAQKLIGLSRGFSPLSVAGLVAWWDLSDIATVWKDTARTSAVTANGDAILGVTDKSGTGNHLSEATNGPTWTTGIQNGKAGARFDGSNDVLRCTGLTQAQPNTWFIVAKLPAVVANHHYLDGATTRQLIGVNGSSNFSIFAGAAPAGSAADTSWHTQSVVFNGASSAMWTDGAAQIATTNAGAQSIVSLRVALDNGGANFTQVDLGALLLYSGALSTTNRQTIEAGLKSQWGTP